MARFTTHELEALAEYAHDAGYSAYHDAPEGQEPDYSRADLERVALDKLAASALYAIHADDQDARIVWAENYYRGWRFGESDAYRYGESTIDLEGVEASDAGEESNG
jgi:hypothetical protein